MCFHTMEKRESSSSSLGTESPLQPDVPSDSPTADAPTSSPAAGAATLSSPESSSGAANAPASDLAAVAPPSGAAGAAEVLVSPAAASAVPADLVSVTADTYSSPAAVAVDVAASAAAPAGLVRAGSAEHPSPAGHSSELHHPRPAGLLPEAGFGILPVGAEANSPWSSSSTASAAEAAAAAQLALPPALPPAPWLWDNSLLDAFAASQCSAAAAGRTTSETGDSAASAAGEFPPSPPSAALFLLPTGGGSVLRLEEAYVCESCCAVRAPEELSVEIEAYYCPNCFDSLTQAEALACGCCCTKCFDCPRCYACLSVMRQPREAAAAAAGRGIGPGASSFPTGASQQQPQQGSDGAAAAANEAEAIVRRLLQETGRSKGGDEAEEQEAEHRLSAEESALLAAAAPQRCESLLSLSSEEEDESSGPEDEGQLAAPGHSTATGTRSRRCSDATEEKDEDESRGRMSQQRCAKRTQEGRRREPRYLYYFGCPYCRWNSQALQITSESSALLPAAAIAEERVGGLLQRYFHQVLDVLQRSARDRERLRQLEARVKHKAVALLFAAAAAHDKRRGHAEHQQKPREQGDDAAAAAASGATIAEGGGEQLLLTGGVSGGNKSWRVSDVEHALIQRAAQSSFARAGEAWAAAYRSDLPQPPQYVGLQQLLRGEHALLQPQEEGQVMTDVVFGWQLQQHEAEQLLKRSRASREGADRETRRNSAAQEHVLEGTGERRRSSIDTTIETPVAIPLHAPQLLLDRPSPDAPPLKLPAERLRGSLLFSRTHATHNSSISNHTGRIGGSLDKGKALEEWWTAEQATLEQRLRNPNSLIAAATSTSLLRPTRKKLLTRESKRCRACTRYLVKAHVSSIAVPPFRVNTAAALLLPWIVPTVSRRGQLLRRGDVADVHLNLLNPTDRPLRLRFYFNHVVSHTPVCALQPDGQRGNEGTGLAAVAKGEEGETPGRMHSPVADKNDRKEAVSYASGAAGASPGNSVLSVATAGRETIDSAAFVTAAEGLGDRFEAKDDAGQQKKAEAVTSARTLSADWETVQIVTPGFELQLDRYDDMLGEFGDFDFAFSRGSSGGASRADDFKSPGASTAAVAWKKGNSAQVRLQVQAKRGSEIAPRQQQPAVCCVTLDVETAALQSNTIRVQYLLFLGHLCATEKA